MADLLFAVGVLLVISLLSGELLERAGQPALIGEIFAGIVVGPFGLEIVTYEGTFAVLSTIGAMLLFLDIGYEHLDLKELLAVGPEATSIAFFGMVVPAITGTAVGLLFGYSAVASGFLGLGLAVTSIAVTARTLVDLDRLDTGIGHRIVGAAVLDDVVGVLAFSFLLVVLAGGTVSDNGVVVGKVIAFFAIAIVARRFLVGRLSSLLEQSRQVGADILTILGVMFLAGFGAEQAGLDVTIGGLVVGLLVGEDDRLSRLEVREGIVGVAYGLFIPVFFAGIGTRIDLSVVTGLDPFVLVVIVAGVVSKFVGGFVGDYVAGGSPLEATTIGVGMLPKAGIGLAMLSRALAAGHVTERMFSAFVVLVLVSVFVTPSLLHAIFPGGGVTSD